MRFRIGSKNARRTLISWLLRAMKEELSYSNVLYVDVRIVIKRTSIDLNIKKMLNTLLMIL